MSYGIHYRGQYQSPMRDEYVYQVDIYTKGYSGAVKDLRFTGDGMTIEHGVTDDDETQAIKASSLTLPLLVTDGEDMSNLFSLDPLKHRIVVGRDTGAQLLVLFIGYLSTGSFSQPYANPPYPLTLQANDGISALQGFKYMVDKNTRYDDTISLSDLLTRVLSPIGSVVFWDLPKVTPLQAGATQDIVGIPSSAIYNVSGDVPTYYDVLLSILEQFSLQLYQSGGHFVVRPLCAVASTQDAMSLYADDGRATGMSTSAVMSMLPPLQSIQISRTGERGGRLIPTMLEPKRWVYEGTYDNSHGDGVTGTHVTPYGLRIRSLSPEQGSGNVSGIWQYTFDGFVRPTPANVELSFKAYNLHDTVSSMYALFFLVPDDVYKTNWIRLNPYATCQIASGVMLWTGGTWIDVAGLQQWNRILTFGFSVAAAQNSQNFWRSCPLDRLTETPVDLTIKGIPESSKKMRMVMAITSSAPFAMEIVEPKISHVDTGDVEVEDLTEEEFVVNRFGTDSLSINQQFRIGEEPPVVSALAPYIYNIEDNTSVDGYVVPSISVDYATSLAGQLRQMRSDVTMQLEGDIYTPEPVDLSTIWKDREGRYYYTNRVKQLLRRGLYNVQLRELAQMRNSRIELSSAIGQLVFSFDTSYIYIASKEVMMHDVATNEIVSLLSTSGTLTAYKGVNSAVIVEYTGGMYNLYAFGSDGAELSVIKDIFGTLAVTNERNPQAYYDATTSTWWLNAYKTSDAQLVTRVLNKSGDVIAERKQEVFNVTAIGYPLPHRMIWEYANGNGEYSRFDYDLLKDTELELNELSTTAPKLLDVNETFIIESVDSVVVIKSADGNKLAVFGGYTYVASNCALVVVHNGANQIIVFDARTLNTVSIPVKAADAIILCGDCVYVATTLSGMVSLVKYRILPNINTSAGDASYIQSVEGFNLLATGD
ncbi:MAG: hypothetical protein J6R02_04250, partial [Alistipes sp.]|nr:hypothetical protein [Alistipes sp.]